MDYKTVDQILKEQIQILADWNEKHKDVETVGGAEPEQIRKNVETIVLASCYLREFGF